MVEFRWLPGTSFSFLEPGEGWLCHCSNKPSKTRKSPSSEGLSRCSPRCAFFKNLHRRPQSRDSACKLLKELASSFRKRVLSQACTSLKRGGRHVRHETGSFAGSNNAFRATRKVPHVIIGGPEWLSDVEMNAVKEAIREMGATVSPHRADVMFHSESFEASCKTGTHLLLFVDNESFPYEKQMLLAAVRIERIAILCLGSCDALKRHKNLFSRRRVSLVITRSPKENSRTTSVVGYHVSHSLVATDIGASAREIARTLLIGWQRQ